MIAVGWDQGLPAGDPAKFVTYFAPEGRLARNGMPELQGEKAILDALTDVGRFSERVPTGETIAEMGGCGNCRGSTVNCFQRVADPATSGSWPSS